MHQGFVRLHFTNTIDSTQKHVGAKRDSGAVVYFHNKSKRFLWGVNIPWTSVTIKQRVGVTMNRDDYFKSYVKVIRFLGYCSLFDNDRHGSRLDILDLCGNPDMWLEIGYSD